MEKSHDTESLESLIPNQPIVRRQRRCSGRSVIITTAISFLVLVTIAFLTAVSRQRSKKSADSEWLSCGNTSTQAVEKDCVWDSLMSSWMHPDCHWPEHYASSREAANTTFYLDKRLTIPFENVNGLWPQPSLYAAFEYHIVHCTYMWERQLIAWTEGLKIDSNGYDLDHTRHCIMTIMETDHLPVGAIAQLQQGFPTCGWPKR